MIKQLLLFICFIFIFYHAVAQTGKVYDNLSMPSKILKMERKYAVYLPPGYETSERSYPVLYLLHGGGDTVKIKFCQCRCAISGRYQG